MARLLVVFLLFLQCLALASCDCAVHGCTMSTSYTCPTDFYSGSFYPELAQSFQDDTWKPTGAGCVTNDGKIDCPLIDSAGNRNLLVSWNINKQFASWNLSMKALVTLPVMSDTGEMFVTDGSQLCGFQSNDKPVGPCITMFPVTGPIFDLTVVAEKFLYLLYKCGFMVAYWINDGTAFASIWLNTTVSSTNGTFIPLSPPAISGERVYFIAGFKPDYDPDTTSYYKLRLYAIDVRSVMVERIKVAWSYDFDAGLGATTFSQKDVANVLFEVSTKTVVALVSYMEWEDPNTQYPASMLISVTDEGDTYHANFIKKKLPPFQAAAYPSPSFAAKACSSSVDGTVTETAAPPLPPPSIWVSWVEPDTTYSKIENINAQTGDVISTLDLPQLANFTVTSKLSIFYNDKPRDCSAAGDGNGGDPDMVVPLVFGYASAGHGYIAAVDVGTSPVQMRWSIKTFDNAAPVGQIATVGRGRDTWMVVTTTQGCFFYLLYSD